MYVYMYCIVVVKLSPLVLFDKYKQQLYTTLTIRHFCHKDVMLWAPPVGPYGLGPCGPPVPLGAPWAFAGWALVGPPWALMGRALVGLPGPLGSVHVSSGNRDQKFDAPQNK